AELLPLPYFHVVFSLPSQIADIAYQNKTVIYDLLFKVLSQTMLTIAADPKHLGARIGILSVLHTWGSALCCAAEQRHEVSPTKPIGLHSLPPFRKGQHTGSPNIKSDLLRCGILTRLMSAQGQNRNPPFGLLCQPSPTADSTS